MTQYKEFHAKSLDDAIRDACEYFGVEREKLEIEIVSDAKTGIFGLVGAKKATIRAAKRQADKNADQKPEASAASGKRRPQPEEAVAEDHAAPKARRASGAKNEEASRKESVGKKTGERSLRGAPKSKAEAKPGNVLPEWEDEIPEVNGNVLEPPKTGRGDSSRRGGQRGDAGVNSPKGQGEGKNSARGDNGRRLKSAPAKTRNFRPVASDNQRSDNQRAEHAFSADAARDDLPEFDLSSCDPDALKARVAGILSRIVGPIVGDVPCEVSIGKDRVRASLDCGDASGLLVGREGQTLASVQYLASRILARELGGSVRLHVDTGNYRERQDDRLKELAQSLAERARKTRRPQMTRPLSAYQRRIVHLALENDPEISTRSKGEGAQRRVMVYLVNQAKDAQAALPDPEFAEGPDDASGAYYEHEHGSVETPEDSRDENAIDPEEKDRESSA